MRNKAQQSLTKHNISFVQGNRDEALFYLANHLVKGGMPALSISKYLTFFAQHCSPPFPQNEVSEKIQSALKRSEVRERNLSQEIRDYVLSTNGHFLSTDVHKELHLSTRQMKKTCSTILSRLVEERIIERSSNKNGCFRRIERNYEKMDFLSAGTDIVDIQLPFGLQDMVEIMPGNIILIAGEPNAGKTALLLNIIRDNMKKFEITYFNSEMGASELKKRLLKFDEISLNEWKFNAYERTDNFADVIVPGKGRVNIIDFLELHDNFYEVSGKLTGIHKKLKGAVAIVALQKNRGTDTGLGGYRSLEKPRLALAMSPGTLKIVKAKNWKTQENPNGKEINFKIVQGCKFVSEGVWKR